MMTEENSKDEQPIDLNPPRREAIPDKMVQYPPAQPGKARKIALFILIFFGLVILSLLSVAGGLLPAAP